MRNYDCWGGHSGDLAGRKPEGSLCSKDERENKRNGAFWYESKSVMAMSPHEASEPWNSSGQEFGD